MEIIFWADVHKAEWIVVAILRLNLSHWEEDLFIMNIGKHSTFKANTFEFLFKKWSYWLKISYLKLQGRSVR